MGNISANRFFRCLRRICAAAALLMAVSLFAPSAFACTNPAGTNGNIIYNSYYSVLQWCDGTTWRAFPKNTTGGTPRTHFKVFWRPDGTSSPGAKGGISGANASCQATATAAGLTGTYAAWLADGNANSAPATRFNNVGTSLPFRLTNGTTIANNWADLIDGSIGSAINILADGTLDTDPSTPYVGTNVTTSGTRASATNHCTNWTVNDGSATSGGLRANTNSQWTAGVGFNCWDGPGTYCFEQGSPDPCASENNPAPGQVCSDGTVYAGLSPDGNAPMFTTRCDRGMTWNGSTCTGTRSLTPWSDGNSNWNGSAGNFTSYVDGDGNTAGATAEDASNAVGFQINQSPAYCDGLSQDGYTDWYLPARDELSVLYANRVAIGHFETSNSPSYDSYWSSTEENYYGAHYLEFDGGLQATNSKNLIYSLRCVRKGPATSCANPVGTPGQIIYNSATAIMQWCDGSKWNDAGISSTAGYTLSQGLVGYWMLDENSGTSLTDVSGNSNTLTTTGSPTWTTGQYNAALDFNGTSQYASRAMTSSLDITGNQVTLSAWIRADVTTGTRRIVSAPTQETVGTEKYALLLSSNSLQFWIRANGSDNSLNTAFTTTGAWRHVVGVYNGSTMKIYVSGVEVASTTVTGSIDAHVSGNFAIGRYGPSFGQYFDGRIDDVRVYNRALSPAEVTQLYNNTLNACSSPAGVGGDMIYNTDRRVPQYCNGVNWVPAGTVTP